MTAYSAPDFLVPDDLESSLLTAEAYPRVAHPLRIRPPARAGR